MNQNDQIPTFKITILGSCGVGKTSYITRLLTGEYTYKYYGKILILSNTVKIVSFNFFVVGTIGSDNRNLRVYTNYGPINLDICEPAGLVQHIY